jgi:drug/metabolite transporter (DMT)-like permease
MFRYGIAAVIILPGLLVVRWKPMPWRDLAPIALLGVAQFAVLIVLLNFGLKYVSSARAALLFTTFPFFTMLLAAMLGQERLTAAKSIGVILTMIGVGVALGEAVLQGGGANEWLGGLLVLASALTGAICSVLYRPFAGRYPPLQVSVVSMVASVAALALVATREGLLGGLPSFNATGWAAVIFTGLASAIAFFAWLFALARTTPTRVTVFLALGPITAALLGNALLGEPLTLRLGLAVALVVAGLVVAHWQGAAAAQR